jgi:outer membrane putative beta-barrel porin/alpha-amylase
MRRLRAAWFLLMMLTASAPGIVRAQGRVPATTMTPPSVVDNPGPEGPLPADFETGVSFLDSALPRSMLRLRFDVDQFNFRPTRAEYLFPADGFHVAETRVHVQELNTYLEYGLNEWFSTFMETPYKWVNPDENANVNGFGDLQFGAKFAPWNTESLLAAFQLKVGAHTSQHVLTGTGHWSIEPSLLLAWRIAPTFTLEGQAGYWVPLGGTDFAGDVFRYGVGLTYGGRSANAIQLMPVAEIVGWTVTGGRELVPAAPGVFLSESAAGDTIINGCLGLRFTLGQNADIYAGYSRCFIGQPWFRDMIRLEFRLFY